MNAITQGIARKVISSLAKPSGIAIVAASALLAGCSSYYYETRAYGSGQYWTGAGGYTVGYRDSCGELPQNGTGYSYYGRYRNDGRTCERARAGRKAPVGSI